MLFHICKSLTRAQSCLSFHASGNPGITKTLREYLWRRIRCKNPAVKQHKVDIEKDMDWRSSRYPPAKREKIIKESVEVREQAKRAPGAKGLTEVAAEHHDQTLIFTRWLGHKSEMPLSAQW